MEISIFPAATCDGGMSANIIDIREPNDINGVYRYTIKKNMALISISDKSNMTTNGWGVHRSFMVSMYNTLSSLYINPLYTVGP